jgi:hypothetical protein
MKHIQHLDDFLNEIKNEDQPKKDRRVGHTVKRGYYKSDPPDIGLYSKGGKDAIKGTGYANKEKAEFTVKELDKLMDKGERVWAMSIATTMESRAKKHQHQTDGMRDAMKIFREWIDKNKKTESIEEAESKTLFHPGEGDKVEGTISVNPPVRVIIFSSKSGSPPPKFPNKTDCPNLIPFKSTFAFELR